MMYKKKNEEKKIQTLSNIVWKYFQKSFWLRNNFTELDSQTAVIKPEILAYIWNTEAV